MPTRRTIRRALAPRLGPYVHGTATAGSTTAVLEATAWPFKSSLALDDLFADQFLYRPDAAAAGDRLRLVAASGYSPSLGQITPDQVWTNGPSGEAFELHGVIPPELDAVNDLHALIDEGLKRCLLVVEFTLTPVANQTRHSLAAAAAWLTEPAWVYEVGYLASGESRNEVDPFRRVVRGEAVKDTNTVYLDHPGRAFNTTDTLYVRALKPAYDACAAAATPTVFTQAGLAAENDVAIPQTEWAVAAAEVEAWDRLADVLAPGNAARAEQKRAEATALLTRSQGAYLEAHALRRTFRPLRRWGPVPGGSGR